MADSNPKNPRLASTQEVTLNQSVDSSDPPLGAQLGSLLADIDSMVRHVLASGGEVPLDIARDLATLYDQIDLPFGHRKEVAGLDLKDSESEARTEPDESIATSGTADPPEIVSSASEVIASIEKAQRSIADDPDARTTPSRALQKGLEAMKNVVQRNADSKIPIEDLRELSRVLREQNQVLAENEASDVEVEAPERKMPGEAVVADRGKVR